ncbi:hypothetical protein GCM10009634_44050 [Saccharothrix xinjiangensis]
MLNTGAVVLMLASCGSGGMSSPAVDTSESAARNSLSSATPTAFLAPADEAEHAALAAYRGMWHAFAFAGKTSDWQSAALGKHATGVALNNLTRGLYADHHNGLVTKGEARHEAKAVSVEPADNPTKIMIADCSDSTEASKYRADNGRLADDTPGERRLINGQVELQVDRSWKVTDFAVHEVGTC